MKTATAPNPNPSATLASAGTLAALLPFIAAMLPGEWNAYRDPHAENNFSGEGRAELVRTDGLTLYAVTGGYSHKGKIHVAHSRPRSDAVGGGGWVEIYEDRPNPYGGTCSEKLAVPSINCADTKTAEQIAADITRRLLPEAEKQERMTREKIAMYEKANNLQLDTLKALCAAIGLSNIPLDHSRGGPRFSGVNLNSKPGTFGSDKGYGDADVHAGKVDFKLSSIPTAKAVALVEWLRANVFAN
jgi:hypothetical protein